MRPSPFAGKLKKKDIKIDRTEQKQQQTIEEPQQQNFLKPPPPSTSNKMLKVSREKGDDRSRGKQSKETQQNEDQDKIQSKPSMTFKPNLQLKAGKKIKLLAPSSQPEPKKQQPIFNRPAMRPNLFKKSEGQRNPREQVIIDEPRHNNNIQQDQHEDSVSQSVSQSVAPKFKIKAKLDHQYPVIHQQPMQKTGFGATNYADLKIQTREMNFDIKQQKVSQVKLQKQKARAKDLKQFLNLQIDLFEQTLNISCVTPYEIYINKIKGGSLKNSNDQAFDQKMSVLSQTLPLQFQDFTNQCPQDYHTDITSIVQPDQNQLFAKFIEKVAPVFQQLIKPSNTVMMPPIFLLALGPEFRNLVTCPFPVFIYFSSALKIGIIVMGQKLLISESEVESVLSIGGNIIGGCKNGTICIWTGKNDRGSKLYKKVQEKTQSTNFQLPQYVTSDLDRFSIYRSESAIVSLLADSSEQFVSLDQNCKMIKWRLDRTNNNLKLKPQNSTQFSNLIHRPNLIGFQVKKRTENYFVSSSAGIIIWNGEEILQKLDTQNIRVQSIALPHRTHFVYVVCDDSSIRIFEENYANELFKIFLPESSQIAEIIVPEMEYQNKKISINSLIYATTKNGAVYSINLLKNANEPKLLPGTEDRKPKDVIFRGVNKLSKGFQFVTLWRDLKCNTSVKNMDVNLQPTVTNIKTILQENRQVHNWLQAENSLTIVAI